MGRSGSLPNNSPCSKGHEGSRNHWLKLNKLTNFVTSQADVRDDDILIWLDSDAFPIGPLEKPLLEYLEHFPFVAVRRDENHRPGALPDKIPHPSFAACRVEFWRTHPLTWAGHRKNAKEGRNDTGGQLLTYLVVNHISWQPLRRTYSLTKHPVWFTIYGNLIYHHGAGSRNRACRAGNLNLHFKEKKMFAQIAQREPYQSFDWEKYKLVPGWQLFTEGVLV